MKINTTQEVTVNVQTNHPGILRRVSLRKCLKELSISLKAVSVGYKKVFMIPNKVIEVLLVVESNSRGVLWTLIYKKVL